MMTNEEMFKSVYTNSPNINPQTILHNKITQNSRKFTFISQFRGERTQAESRLRVLNCAFWNYIVRTNPGQFTVFYFGLPFE